MHSIRQVPTHCRQFHSIRFASAFIVALSIGFSAFPAQAISVKPVSMKAIVESSGTIVHGIVTKVVSGKDEQTGMICTWTTVKVMDGLKGKTDSKEVTFKQIGGYDKETKTHWMFEKSLVIPGEEILICLHPESRLGLTSPVGYAQGVFRVKARKSTGKKYVDNGMPESVLFPKDSGADGSKDKGGLSAKESAALDKCRSMKLDDVMDGISGFVSIQKSKTLSPHPKVSPEKYSR